MQKNAFAENCVCCRILYIHLANIPTIIAVSRAGLHLYGGVGFVNALRLMSAKDAAQTS